MSSVIGCLLLLCSLASAQIVGQHRKVFTPAPTGCTSGTCSDAFAGTSGTLLATHDAQWTSMNATVGVGTLKLDGSGNVITNLAADKGGAFYASSTADVSSLTWKAQSINGAKKGPCVRSSATGTTDTGYCAYLSNVVGANYTRVSLNKNGTGLTSYTSLTIPYGSDHTVKITVSGTTTVTIHVWLDGTDLGAKTDSSATITSGSPGFFVIGSSTAVDNGMANWSDH